MWPHNYCCISRGKWVWWSIYRPPPPPLPSILSHLPPPPPPPPPPPSLSLSLRLFHVSLSVSVILCLCLSVSLSLFLLLLPPSLPPSTHSLSLSPHKSLIYCKCYMSLHAGRLWGKKGVECLVGQRKPGEAETEKTTEFMHAEAGKVRQT